MKKVFFTFVYGNFKTKFSLFLMSVGMLIGSFFLIYGITIPNSTMIFASIILLLADCGYILSTDFKTLEAKAVKRKAGIPEKPDKEKNTRLSLDGESRKVDKKKKNKHQNDAENDADDTSEEDIPGRAGRNREGLTRAEAGLPEDRSDDVHTNPLLQYDEKYIKKLLIQYKVRKDHVLILIDSCKKEHISECPAILWVEKDFAFLLLLEKQPRMVKFNIYDYNEMHINAGAPANPNRDYADFKADSFITRIYKPFLPNLSVTEDEKTGKKSYKKALYGIGPDIFCTSNSVKNILKVLSVNVVLTESRINRGTYGDYFKRVYISRLMYRDRIFSPEEYKDKVMRILDEMAKNASEDDFKDNLTQMTLGGLIPNEYAEYATFKRKKG